MLAAVTQNAQGRKIETVLESNESKTNVQGEDDYDCYKKDVLTWPLPDFT